MTESIRTTRLENPDANSVEEMTDESPHDGGRAQPGDVLGIETGGETTEIGDTSEDENERRRRAEKDASGTRPVAPEKNYPMD
jgi:hypothetical protein